MDKKKLDYFRKKLNKEVQNLDSTIDKMKDYGEASLSEHMPRELSSYDNHPADLGSELYTAEMNMALKVHEESRLHDARHALNKIEKGSYGICEKCRKPIEYERLDVLPYARYCMDCETANELTEINRPDQQYNEVFDAPFGRKYLNKREDDEFEGMDQLNDLMKYGSADTPQDLGGYEDYDEYYTNEIDNQGIVEEVDKISNQQYKDQLP